MPIKIKGEKLLSDADIRSAKPRDNEYTLADGGALYLVVTPEGRRRWLFRYRHEGKTGKQWLGEYPAVTLAAARKARDVSAKDLGNGVDPREAKQSRADAKRIAEANSFEAVARECHRVLSPRWSERHAAEWLASLEKEAFPHIGAVPLTALKAPAVLAVLRKIEQRGAAEIAHRVRQRIGRVFAFAIAQGMAEDNPVTAMAGALTPRKKEPRAALSKADLPGFLSKLAEYGGDPITKIALRLTLLTFVRTTEAIGARWDEFDLAAGVWNIPAERMKMKAPHVVPLARQVIALLEELRPHSGRYELLFPGRHPAKPISNNTMLYAMYRMGYHSKATVHGFRATASTILNEAGFHADAIERQLAHKEANAIRAAYHRAQYMEERTRLMQWWSDFIDQQAGANVVPLPVKKTA